MSVLSYLNDRAATAVLSATERNSIVTSVSTISSRMDSYFVNDGDKLSAKFCFGSYTRGTILPRADDVRSDIDYMVVFEKGGLKPQTYLDRLRRFVETKYSTSEIYQSNPTIVLDLNHIKFELVPALAFSGGFYNIPQDTSNWQATNPNDFNSVLENANKNNSYLLKPTIRLAKIWNAANGYVFSSYLFEKWMTNKMYLFCNNQKEYIYSVFDSLSASESAQWKNDRISRAKTIVSNTRYFESQNMPFNAETEIKKLIPE